VSLLQRIRLRSASEVQLAGHRDSGGRALGALRDPCGLPGPEDRNWRRRPRHGSPLVRSARQGSQAAGASGSGVRQWRRDAAPAECRSRTAFRRVSETRTAWWQYFMVDTGVSVQARRAALRLQRCECCCDPTSLIRMPSVASMEVAARRAIRLVSDQLCPIGVARDVPGWRGFKAALADTSPPMRRLAIRRVCRSNQ
jgi:hypothetical protein